MESLAEKLQRAHSLHQTGRLQAARTLCQELLKAQPQHFDALNLLGVVEAQSNNARKAVKLLDRAIEIDPNSAAAHCNRGTALRELGQLQAALRSYERAIELRADYAMAYVNRGHVLNELGQPEPALESFRCAIESHPALAEAHFGHGKALKELRRLAEALASYDRALAIRSDYSDAYVNRGGVLFELGQYDAAMASLDRAILLQPQSATAHFNRANVFKELGRLEEALADYERAIALRPDYIEAYTNRGFVLKETGQWDAALSSYNRALSIRQDFAEARLNRGTLCLLKGDFDRGWIDYEWRWKADRLLSENPRHFRQPRWTGREDISGKTLLLHSEQGLGDTLQFCRYASVLAARGARILLEVHSSLVNLLLTLEGVSEVTASAPADCEFDYHCPLLSLPLALKTTAANIPASFRYLTADAAKVERWQARLCGLRQPRIGIAWSGNPRHTNDRNRSIPLADLASQLPAGFDYVCLQTQVRDADLSALTEHPRLMNVAEDLRDFTDTAAVCECLDLVISVDTSVAHLAGALGKQTWALLPFNPDWRWQLARHDTPWYPTMRLLRQPIRGDWRRVLEQMSAEIATLSANYGPSQSAISAAPG